MSTKEQLKMRCWHGHDWLDYDRMVAVKNTCPRYEETHNKYGRVVCVHGEIRGGRLDLCGPYCLLDEMPEQILEEHPFKKEDVRGEVIRLTGPRQRPIGYKIFS